MKSSEPATLLAFFKAMANESRLRLVGLMAGKERTVQELAELLELKEPTVSHHLAVLKEIGLVDVRADGVMRWHRLKPEALRDMNRALLDRSDVEALAPRTLSWEEKVRATFVASDGQLKAIPASRRKRWIILKWLLEDFRDGVDYSEAEINAHIQRHHWDSATLRREFIGYRMMARNSGIYRRLPESEWLDFQSAKGAET